MKGAAVVLLALVASSLAVDVNTFLSSLAEADANRASTGQVTLDYQNMASHTHFDHDNAKLPLFTTVDSSLLQRPTYAALQKLIADFKSPDANVADPLSSSRTALANDFIDALNTTAVFSQGWQYLTQMGIASSDYATYRKLLVNLWFTVFARGSAAGSSAFETVYAGEYLNGNVVGLSNWVRFYQEESSGAIDYHGWFDRQPNVQISLQFGWTQGGEVQKAIIAPVLFDTSPEFEITAFTICGLVGRGSCSISVAGDGVILNVATRTENGNLVIDNAFTSIGAKGTTTHKPSGPTTTHKPVTGSQGGTPLRELVTKMRAADSDKASTSQYKINWGKKISGHATPSGEKLLSDVDESVFTRKVFSVLTDVYDNNILKPDVCTAESDYNSGFKKSLFTAVLDAWAATDVFKLMHDYLVAAGKADADVTIFKSMLYKFWFGTYSRCTKDKKIIGSSGFEHVFSGEWKNGEVDGQHNWMKYYLLEKKGDISYYGYYTYDGQFTGTFEYDWIKEKKREGGFLFSTSPAFDFSLFTACALTEGGAKKCRFNIDGYELAVTSYTIECAGGGTCLATSYPVDKL